MHTEEQRAVFTSMERSTAEDWGIIGANFVEFARKLPDRVLAHLRLLDGDYGGFAEWHRHDEGIEIRDFSCVFRSTVGRDGSCEWHETFLRSVVASTVTVAPPPAIAQCKNCHDEHHAAGRTCSSCHTLADPKAAHASLEVAHQRCDACHTATTVAQLTPTRTFCSTCHAAKAADHYAPKECTTCHFLTEPGSYRAKLTKTSG